MCKPCICGRHNSVDLVPFFCRLWHNSGCTGKVCCGREGDSKKDLWWGGTQPNRCHCQGGAQVLSKFYPTSSVLERFPWSSVSWTKAARRHIQPCQIISACHSVLPADWSNVWWQGGKLAAQYDVGSKDQRSLEFKEEWEKSIENKWACAKKVGRHVPGLEILLSERLTASYNFGWGIPVLSSHVSVHSVVSRFSQQSWLESPRSRASFMLSCASFFLTRCCLLWECLCLAFLSIHLPLIGQTQRESTLPQGIEVTIRKHYLL